MFNYQNNGRPNHRVPTLVEYAMAKKEMEMMKKFKIRYGLGGGFGGPGDWEEIEAENLDEAEFEAWCMACEVYESYTGLYGIRGVDEIMEEEGFTEEEALDEYHEDRESWIEYEAEEIE